MNSEQTETPAAPPPAPPPILNIYYDLRAAPVTFDAAVFLAVAIAWGRRKGHKWFRLIIVANSFRNVTARERSYGLSERIWRLTNLIYRLGTLIPGVGDINIIKFREIPVLEPKFPVDFDPAEMRSPPYLWAHLLHAHSLGVNVQVFDSTDYAKTWAREYLKTPERSIVMTVRRADFNRERDAVLADWFKLYEHFRAQGYEVVMIPDQWDAMYAREFAEFPWRTCPEASMDLDLRLALYQSCYANIAWAGGQTALMWLAKCRFLLFGVWNEQTAVSNAAFFVGAGFPVGSQPAHFLPFQRFDWQEASSVTVDYMIATSDSFLLELAGQPASAVAPATIEGET